VALAHTRLAVIAPGAGGAQPMCAAHGARVVSYNGEIYNHQALRAELESRGHRFRGASDTEVLLAMYDEFGDRMLERLRGMFAFALWDARAGELLLARDGYGIKPLYYSDDGRTVRVASQVKALRQDPGLGLSRDPAGWAGYYLFGSVPEPFTTFREVRSLPAGCLMRVGPAGPGHPRRWFNLARVLRDAEPAPPGAASPVLRQALRESVAAHLVADVPVGLFLSAGLDSSVLLALSAELGRSPLTVTLEFDEFRGDRRDEATGARRTARHFGARHRLRRVAAREFRDDLPRLLAAMDQPSIDGVNTWFVSKAAAELGLKVALSGVGGDELFTGYPSFTQVPWLVRGAYLPSRVPGLGRLGRHIATPLLRGARWHPKLAGLLALGGSYAGAWLLRRGLFMPWELGSLMGAEAAREGLAALAPLELLQALMCPDPGTARGRVMALEAGAYLRNQLLRDADWAGMAHGVEIRTPLVDPVLTRELAPVLVGRRAGEGKDLLARVPISPLPLAVTGRPKTGFSVPLEAWLRAQRPRAAHPAHVATIRDWALRVGEAA
jgi:asparagine synthase (glutamine-hydrolysing)